MKEVFNLYDFSFYAGMVLISLSLEKLSRANVLTKLYKKVTLDNGLFWIQNKRFSLSLERVHILLYVFYIIFYDSVNARTISVMQPVTDEPRNPCLPSPCGPFSQCQNINGIPSCSCLPTYMGSPPTCRPECTINSDCPSTRACINERCRDPCLGSCGLNAICNVFNHIPSCNCMQSYSGDPFTGCTYQPPRKLSMSCTFLQNFKNLFTKFYWIFLLNFIEFFLRNLFIHWISFLWSTQSNWIRPL